jgi:hypothetical protein
MVWSKMDTKGPLPRYRDVSVSICANKLVVYGGRYGGPSRYYNSPPFVACCSALNTSTAEPATGVLTLFISWTWRRGSGRM